MSKLSDEQKAEDRAFCKEVWTIWLEYGGGTNGDDENFWPEVTSKLSAVCKTPLQVTIGMGILEEIRRRSK